MAKISVEQVNRILEGVQDEDREALIDAILPYIQDLTVDGAEQGLAQLGMRFEDLLEQANEKAIAWAEERAAGLVGMRRLDDGSFVENPNADWRIDATTRDGIRDMVTGALEDGVSNDDLADRLEESFLFSEDRAETIARTETAFADVQGNVIGWQESGVVAGKEWITADADPCEDCDAMNGVVVGMDEDFEGGDPPRHPNCRCDLLPVLVEASEEAA